MGNFSRDTFKLTNTMYRQISGGNVKDPKHYVGVRLQQGVPLVDADWNELEDIRRYEQRAMLKWLVGDGVPQGNDGFRIKDAAANDLTVNQGICYVNGWAVINLTDTKYTAQELYNNDKLAASRGADPLPPLQLEAGQQYEVYLDVWEREIDRQEDGRIVNDAIGIETCVRIKLEWVVRVTKGAQAPAAKAGHGYYKLAALTVSSAGSVTIDDLRRTDLAVLPKEYTIKNGNIGIGTAQPNGKLEINTGPANQPALRLTGSSQGWGAALQLNDTSAGGKNYFIFSRGGYLLIGDDTANRLVIDGNGRIGIGTTTSDKLPLCISSADDVWGTGISLDNRAAQGGKNFCITSLRGRISITDMDNLEERLVIDGNGNVGIGNIIPTAKLLVGDNVRGSAHSVLFKTNAGSLGVNSGDELALASIGLSSANNGLALGIRARRVSNGSDWHTTAICLGVDMDNHVRTYGQTLMFHPNGSLVLGAKSVVIQFDRNTSDPSVMPNGSFSLGGILSSAPPGNTPNLHFFWKDYNGDLYSFAIPGVKW